MKGKVRGKVHNLILLAEGVGGAEDMAKHIQQVTGIETRATILGHIQRGGSPSAFDRILASRMGGRAVQALLEGRSQRVVGIRNNIIEDFDIDEALNVEKTDITDVYELAKTLSF